jgi:hypothetical protein
VWCGVVWCGVVWCGAVWCYLPDHGRRDVVGGREREVLELLEDLAVGRALPDSGGDQGW